MQERGKPMDKREARQSDPGVENPSPPIWSSLSVLAVALAAGFILARLEAGPKFDWLLLMTAMGLTAAFAGAVAGVIVGSFGFPALALFSAVLVTGIATAAEIARRAGRPGAASDDEPLAL